MLTVCVCNDSRNCCLVFRNIDTERIVEEWTAPTPEGGLEVVAGDPLIAAGRGSHRELREEDNFRRIQYRREVLSYPGRGGWLRCENNYRW